MPRLRVLALLALSLPAAALQEGWRTPPQEVVDLVTAPPSASVRLSPDGEHMLMVESEALPSLAQVSRRMLRLAGMRLDPAANGRHRTVTSNGLVLRRREGGQGVRVPLPAGSTLHTVSWSHDSDHFVFTVVTEAGTELWAGRVASAATPRRLSARVAPVLLGVGWMPDGSSVLVPEVPADRGTEPAAPRVPAGPNVQQTSGSTSPLRTYQDLLSSPHDEALFEHYARVQLALVHADGRRRDVGRPAIFARAQPAPDGKHVLVERIQRPFSWLMPASRFPREIAVMDTSGNDVHVVARVPLGEGIPIGGVRQGPRNVSWRPGSPATLVWVEALDGGDPEREVEHRDRWMSHNAPFDGQPMERLRIEHRAWGLSFLEDGRHFVASEYDRDRRWVRTTLYGAFGNPRVIEDRSTRDRYGDPGRLMTTRDGGGFSVVRVEDGHVLRSGSGASPEGLLPFLDRQSLETLETERLWRCEPGSYESVADVLHAGTEEPAAFVTRHESPTSPPNYRLRSGEGGADVVALTSFPDPTPALRGIKKELVTYERADGVPLSATLYTPADHVPGERLPLLVWAYPLEYNDPSTAGQISASPWRFTRVRGASHLALVTQGYAVMDGATMPVIGDPETMNDTFVEQIVQAAQAAIDKADEMGAGDPNRVAVGGHSYGAFMTANLLAHCDLFRAGIARSGAYNRTLTPFGFQSERRTIWKAPETYFSVSPFFHIDGMQGSLLLIHGEIDNNSGTYPMQSERLFQACKGNGKDARLVMLPHESHGYRARESVLHVLAEMIEWLDAKVKVAAATPASYGGSAGR